MSLPKHWLLSHHLIPLPYHLWFLKFSAPALILPRQPLSPSITTPTGRLIRFIFTDRLHITFLVLSCIFPISSFSFHSAALWLFSHELQCLSMSFVVISSRLFTVPTNSILMDESLPYSNVRSLTIIATRVDELIFTFISFWFASTIFLYFYHWCHSLPPPRPWALISLRLFESQDISWFRPRLLPILTFSELILATLFIDAWDYAYFQFLSTY